MILKKIRLTLKLCFGDNQILRNFSLLRAISSVECLNLYLIHHELKQTLIMINFEN